MTKAAAGRLFMLLLSANVCFYMLRIHVNQGPCPKGRKGDINLWLDYSLFENARQKLCPIFLSLKLKKLHLEIRVKISFSPKRRPANHYLVTTTFVSTCPNATLSSLPFWLDTPVYLFSLSVLSIARAFFDLNNFFWFWVPTGEVVRGASLSEKENYFEHFKRNFFVL